MEKNIFEPVSLANIALKNRIVRSATDEHLATDAGLPTEALETVYRRLAEGGTGLILTGCLWITRSASPESGRPGYTTTAFPNC